ncbi:MAG: virulence RhuM family protein [Kiritimatiellae bacterium]|nr:virulence RhuM family protein [Kiritimatiellia bacterium]
MKTPSPQPSETPVVLYQTEDGTVRVSALVQDETLWLTQAAMAALFDVAPQNITYHLKQVYESDELREEATCKEILQVQNEGGRKVSRSRKFYDLDAIIAVGYRVNSKRATQFRIWATGVLREYELFNRTQRIDSDFDKLVRAASRHNP